MWLELLLLVCAPAFAQTPPLEDTFAVGPGFVSPKLAQSVEPKYTQEALETGVQGTVVLEITVDEEGKATDPIILSSPGFGLDESAVGAVLQWKFTPGSKAGKPVRVQAVLEVNFRISGKSVSDTYLKRSTEYNAAVKRFTPLEGRDKTSAVEAMRRLAREGFAPAMFALATWIENGRMTPVASENVAKLLTTAADLKFPAAMCEVGRRSLLGQGFPVDREKGLRLLREAASRGNQPAQMVLAVRYEAGEGVPQDRELALKYYRFCAGGEPACQFFAARILLSALSRKERDVIEAVARLELAADRAYASALTLLDQERPNLTAAQAKRVAALKERLASPK